MSPACDAKSILACSMDGVSPAAPGFLRDALKSCSILPVFPLSPGIGTIQVAAMPILQKRIQFHAAAVAGDLLLSPLAATWRVSIEDPDGMLRSIAAGRGVHIAAFWHRYILALLCLFRGYPVCVPVSTHSDAEYIAHIMNRYGLKTVRGSTTRGAVRLVREIVRRMDSGTSCALTPDGPRGPACSVQPGFILLARRTGAPVHPVGMAVSSGWVFNSWDRLIVPKPYAKIGMVVGPALPVLADCDSKSYCEMLRDRIMQCGEQAAEYTRTSV